MPLWRSLNGLDIADPVARAEWLYGALLEGMMNSPNHKATVVAFLATQFADLMGVEQPEWSDIYEKYYGQVEPEKL